MTEHRCTYAALAEMMAILVEPVAPTDSGELAHLFGHLAACLSAKHPNRYAGLMVLVAKHQSDMDKMAAFLQNLGYEEGTAPPETTH